MRRSAALALLALATACGAHQYDGPPTPAQILKQRPYHLFVPSHYSGATPAPLILGLHGYGSSSAEFEDWWKLTAACEAHGVLYTSLDGQPDRDGNQRWNAVPNSTLAPYDDLYLSSVIDDISAKYSVDKARVFVVGHSTGAFMAHRAACDLSPRLAAILSYAGQVPSADSLCHPTTKVSVVEVHGDRDDVILYDGSNGPSAHDTVASWADRAGCTGKLAATGTKLDVDADLAGAETRVDGYTGCPAGIGVELWTVVGGSHAANLVEPQWAETVVGWLLAHPKESP